MLVSKDCLVSATSDGNIMDLWRPFSAQMSFISQTVALKSMPCSKRNQAACLTPEVQCPGNFHLQDPDLQRFNLELMHDRCVDHLGSALS